MIVMNGGLLNRRDILAFGLVGVLPRFAMAEDSVPTLVVEKAQASLLEDPQVTTEIIRMRTNGRLPVVRARQGVNFNLRFVNTLAQEIQLQFFGVRGPEAVIKIVLPAKTAADDPFVDVSFTPPDAGTFWIGPAQDASKLRDQGLVALLVVDEAVPTNIADVPLILDDWMIDDKGVLDTDYGNLERLISTGRVGNWLTVNTQFKPRIAVPRGGPVRLRLFNAANMSVMKLNLRGTDPLVLALDGQPLSVMKPLGSDVVLLAPGQRADLLLPGVEALVALSVDLGADTVEVAFLEPEGSATLQDLPDNFRLPSNSLSAIGPEARTVPIIIEGGAQGGLVSAQVGLEELELRQMLERGLAWALNGIAGPGGPVLFTALRGETLLLEIDNRTGFDQVMCVTGHVWYVIELNGAVVDFQPRRDTVVVPAKGKTKLMMVADNPGLWNIQSTQADRADGGMLATFSVEAELP